MEETQTNIYYWTETTETESVTHEPDGTVEHETERTESETTTTEDSDDDGDDSAT